MAQGPGLFVIHVAWYSSEPDRIARGFWDHGWLEAFFADKLWPTAHPFTYDHDSLDAVPEGEGAIVVVPGRWHFDKADEINVRIQRLPWVLLIVTGDEETVFPLDAIQHPNMRAWVQTPRPSSVREGVRYVGDLWPPSVPESLDSLDAVERDLEWFFAGQINTESRQRLVETLESVGGSGWLAPTDTFGSGLELPEYLNGLTRAKVAPCPSGPFTPDSFRLFEALEAGCVPVVESVSPNYGEPGYWDVVCPGYPFPVVSEWAELPAILSRVSETWPVESNRCSAWWQFTKRELAYRIEADVSMLSGEIPSPCSQITVLIPTSPTPLHPDTGDIETVIASVRERLPHAEIIVMADGVHPELEHRRDAYERYQERLLWLAEHRWPGVVPMRFDDHTHQAAMTRAALEHVRTPLLLFVEHDTPLVGDIPFDGLSRAVLEGHADLIRLHHEATILPEHRHLVLDERPVDVNGVPMVRTFQWSQRPHLASAGFYRRVLSEHFAPTQRTMLEDVLHSVVQDAWDVHGLDGWDRYRLWIYSPKGDIKRSGHLDSRGSDPKITGEVKV